MTAFLQNKKETEVFLQNLYNFLAGKTCESSNHIKRSSSPKYELKDVLYIFLNFLLARLPNTTQSLHASSSLLLPMSRLERSHLIQRNKRRNICLPDNKLWLILESYIKYN